LEASEAENRDLRGRLEASEAENRDLRGRLEASEVENRDLPGRLEASAENRDLQHRMSDLEGSPVEGDGNATYDLYFNPWLL